MGDVIAPLSAIGIMLAARLADAKLHYGLGRIEILAGLTIGFILAIGGVGISYRSLQKATEVHSLSHWYAMWPNSSL